jgi:hypothetical protein
LYKADVIQSLPFTAMSLSSAELYSRILKNASKAEGLATIEDETQVRRNFYDKEASKFK